MRHLFLSLVCFFVSCTCGCTEMPSGMPQVDQKELGEASLLQVDLSIKINELLTEGVRQLLSGGDVNIEGFKQITYELLSNPEYLSLMEKASLMEGSECGSCGDIEGDSCGGAIDDVDTSCSDAGDSCAALN